MKGLFRTGRRFRKRKVRAKAPRCLYICVVHSQKKGINKEDRSKKNGHDGERGPSHVRPFGQF